MCFDTLLALLAVAVTSPPAGTGSTTSTHRAARWQHERSTLAHVIKKVLVAERASFISCRVRPRAV